LGQGFVADGHGVDPAGAVDDRDLAIRAAGFHRGDVAGHGGGVHGGGHDEDLEGGTHAAQVQDQGKGQVAVDGTFVELVKNNNPDGGKLGVALEAAHQEAFGEDFDSGAAGHAAFHPDRVAYLLPYPLSQ
jgi:hypothetical protein